MHNSGRRVSSSDIETARGRESLAGDDDDDNDDESMPAPLPLADFDATSSFMLESPISSAISFTHYAAAMLSLQEAAPR